VSAHLVKAEIKRFLASDVAEVLCIKGKWGVGKTYAWNTYYREAATDGPLGLKEYSYVSLFGLSDLESLRNSIFENSVTYDNFSSGPDIKTLTVGFKKVFDIAKKINKYASPLWNIIPLKGLDQVILRASFLTVRSQIICIDDLERRGSSLSIRDVMGLASMLKEQRHCKVVLLLNDERLAEDDKKELERQLEKVVDVSLVFDPSSQEATDIALSDGSELSAKLKEKFVKLGITNIRVIKKIERLAIQATTFLSDFRVEVFDQAIHAIVLGGWSILQPDIAPPIKFIERYNSMLSAMAEAKPDETENEREWKSVIEGYGWSHCDELDKAVFVGVEKGYFDEQLLAELAEKLEADFNNSKENSPFAKAWRRYHDSFLIDDDKFLDGLYDDTMQSLHTIDPINLSSTTLLMREFGRDQQADNLIKAYFAQPKVRPNQLNEDLELWGEREIDPAVVSGFKKLKNEYVDKRNPKDVLIKMATNRSCNAEDIILLSKQNSDDFVNIFESIHDSMLTEIVKYAISLGKFDGHHHQLLDAAVTGALKAIASKSPLRKRRISNYGIVVD